MRLGLGFAWVVIVVGEMTGVQTGLGAIIMEARQLSRTEIVISGMIVIGAFGFLSDQLVMLIGRRLLRWSPVPWLKRLTPHPGHEERRQDLSQNGRPIEALRDANLRVKKGEFVCLIGASGCGKSTLLRMAAGFEAADAWRRPDVGHADRGARPEPRHGVPGLRPVSLADVRDNIGFGPKSRRPHARPRSRTRRAVSSSWSACRISPTSIRTSSPAA